MGFIQLLRAALYASVEKAHLKDYVFVTRHMQGLNVTYAFFYFHKDTNWGECFPECCRPRHSCVTCVCCPDLHRDDPAQQLTYLTHKGGACWREVDCTVCKTCVLPLRCNLQIACVTMSRLR